MFYELKAHYGLLFALPNRRIILEWFKRGYADSEFMMATMFGTCSNFQKTVLS